MLKFIVLSIALQRPGTILLVTGEITCLTKSIKTYIFLESCHECAKGLLLSLLSMQKSVI